MVIDEGILGRGRSVAGQHDFGAFQVGQQAHDPELVVDLHVPKVGEQRPALCRVHGDQHVFIRDMNLDEIVAVGRSEIEQSHVYAAECQVQFVFEGNAGKDGIPVLADDVRNDVCVADAHRRVGEGAGIADVGLVIVAQDDVSHGHVVALIKLLLQPFHGTGVAVVAVDNDDAFVREDIDAELVVRPPPVDVFGDLLDGACFRPIHAVLRPAAR